jgi:hypothetical protein
MVMLWVSASILSSASSTAFWIALHASAFVTEVVLVSSIFALLASTSKAAFGDSPPSVLVGSATITSFVKVSSACSLSVLFSSAFSKSAPSSISVICA